MELTFLKIVRNSVFDADFQNLTADNQLSFPDTGIVVLYGPNGVGKSSLASALSGGQGTEYVLHCDGIQHCSTDESSLFHVIPDQNGRNIIQGSTQDFMLGDNIRREYELKEAIEKDFQQVFNAVIINTLKSEFGIIKKQSPLVSRLKNEIIRRYVEDLANKQSKGKGIDRAEFLLFVQSLEFKSFPEYDEKKFRFLIDDINNTKSVIAQIVTVLDQSLTIDPAITRVEEHSDAISMLNKYYYLTECVVCDNDIDRQSILTRKEEDRSFFLERLDETAKLIFEGVKDRLGENDPFEIKKVITETARTADTRPLQSLLAEIDNYMEVVDAKINNLFATCLDDLSLVEFHKEYKSLIRNKPELTDEDVLFIERFVNDCIDRKIELERDLDGNLQLLLGQKPFLNKDRRDLQLSNGEQNFISITFELLKAQKTTATIVVLDDPISSFDSIFKNKITYAIAKFLGLKKQILLTHNTDLVKLLEHQRPSSFNLYILNNVSDERNGFIQVSRAEQTLLLYLHKLIEFLRDEVNNFVRNERNLLIALVPFMRSFSRILNKPDITDQLTQIMHGYGDSSVELTMIYGALFGSNDFSHSHTVTIQDILHIDLQCAEILDPDCFPLLNRALLHVLNYLWLRLHVENTLVVTYKINTNKYDQLSRIVTKAFGGNDLENVKRRVFLLSRKTLLNEFNHFEQDLNVFQPAIDISDTALKKEREDIMTFLSSIK